MFTLDPSPEALHAHRHLDGVRRPPTTVGVATRFRQIAAAHPGRWAVQDGQGEGWTYAELAARAAGAARALDRLGVSRGSAVAVALPRTAHRVALQIACAWLGVAFVPVDPAWPGPRIATVLAAVGAELTVVAGTWRPVDGGPTVEVGDIVGRTAAGCVDVPVRGRPDDVLYVNFTSGSTGAPKGVPITQGAVVNLVDEPTYVPLGPASVVVHLAPVTFDASTFEVWGPLLNGGTCALYPDRLFRCSEFGAFLRDRRVTTVFLTTALFNAVLDESPQAFDDVSHVLTGGEAHSTTHVARALARYGPDRVSNVYGPTETTTFATHHRVGTVPPGTSDVPIGRPIQNMSARVVRDGTLCATGEIGELWLAGPGLARGYLDPSSDDRHAFDEGTVGDYVLRVYRTGDLVLVDEDGQLRFRGRVDDQIKRRGHRIEPDEIAHHVNQHPAVRTSIVVCEPGRFDQPTVTAVAVRREPCLAPPDVMRHLRERLPAQLLPDHVVVVDELPVGATGKVDRAALRGRLAQRAPG